MAYLAQTEEEKQKEEATSSLLAGFGAAPARAQTSAPGTAPAPAPAAPQQASSAFIPYSAYQQANQGGAQRMAGEVAGRVGATAEKVQQGSTTAQEEFANQVRAGSPFAGPGPTGVTQRIADWQSMGAPATQQAPAVPRAVVARAPLTAPTHDVAMANASKKYGGPTSIESLDSWQKLGPETRAAQDELAATASDEGRQALLQRQYGTSGGNSRLDAALTGSAGGSAFDALRAKYGDLVGARAADGARWNRNANDAATTTTATAAAFGDIARGQDQQTRADAFTEQWKKDHPVAGPTAPPGAAPSSLPGAPPDHIGETPYVLSDADRAYRQQIQESMHAGGDMLGNLSTSWNALGLSSDQQDELFGKMTPAEVQEFVRMNALMDRYQHGSMFNDDKSRYQGDPYAEIKQFLASLKGKYGLK